MGKRLTKIYTRTGDDGSTGLADGSRALKHDARIEAIGTVDELNSLIGALRAALAADEPIQEELAEIQHDLFDLGGELAQPDCKQWLISKIQVDALEKRIDAINHELPPLSNFVLPGGENGAAACHVARSVCRRAERRLLSFSAAANARLNPQAQRYLNRLSDYLFVVARFMARRDGGSETLWKRPR